MRLLRTVTLIAGATPLLAGCWAVFIPGSVTGAISDAVTGAEGANCVSEAAKVGDRIRLPDASMGTIKSLSGTSSRCTDSTRPIRALIALTGEKLEPPHSALTLTFPTGWKSKKPTDQQAAGGAIASAVNTTIDSGAALFAAPRSDVTDLRTFTLTRRSNQEARLKAPESSDVSEIEIDGRRAFRFQVKGTPSSGSLLLVYEMTVIEGRSEIAILNTWAIPANFETHATEIRALAEGIQGL